MFSSFLIFFVLFHSSKGYKLQEIRYFAITTTTYSRVLRVYMFNPIQDGLFWSCSRMGIDGGGKKPPPYPLPKICHTYPTMMKLGTVITYLKKIQKMYEVRDAPLEFW